MAPPSNPAAPLSLLSVIIPARDEEGCICSAVEHLHLELRLHNIPHEIIVVDDGSTDRTWELLSGLKAGLPVLSPVKNEGQHGFGRAIICGLDHMNGDALVIMMADESDDCHDVVRYWEELNKGYDCVFGSRFVKGGGVIDYPRVKLLFNRLANLFIRMLFRIKLNDTTNAFKAYRRDGDRRLPPADLAAFQSHGRIAAQSDRARLHLDGDSDHLAQSPHRCAQIENQGNGQPLSLHLPLCLAGEIFQPRRLSETMTGQDPKELELIYDRRFAGQQEYRNRVWQVLIGSFFQKFIPPDASVLDLGCGYGEFINNVRCATKYGMDLNPMSARMLAPGIRFLQQDCSAPWPLADDMRWMWFSRAIFSSICRTRRRWPRR